MPELRRKCTQPRPAHNALRNPRVVHLSALLWRWVDTKTLTRCALVTPIPATSQTQATESGVLGHSPLFRQPNPPPPRPHNILSQRPRQPSFFIFSTEACIAHEPGASSGIAGQTVCSLWLQILWNPLGPRVSHPPMAQVGSPSSCQTKARDSWHPCGPAAPALPPPTLTAPKWFVPRWPCPGRQRPFAARLEQSRALSCSTASRTLGKN